MADNPVQTKNSLLTYVRLSLHMIGLNIASAAEYRLSFVSQVIGIMLNDFSHILIWLIFFRRFQIINGWQFTDIMLLMGIFLLSFGFLSVLSGGLIELAKYIVRGDLDYFLSFPKNPLWHTAVNRLEIPGLGDALLGIIVFLFFTGSQSLEKIIIYILVSSLSGIIIVNFAIITQSLGFFFGNFEESADRWLWTLFGIALYPQTIFGGWLKVFTLTVFPTFFIIYLPVEILKHFNWTFLGLLAGFALLTFVIGITVFYKGLRRYESGNLINVRI